MSANIRMLTQSEVNKKIIQPVQKVRPHEDLLGPLDRYDDDNYQIYSQKKKQFQETCKQYKKLNEETMISSKKKLHEDYRSLLKCDFLETDSEELVALVETSGIQIRKRTVRPIHEVYSTTQSNCNLEPWLRRYLILNKFIWAARTVVLQNRLLKNLEKLKKLDDEQIEHFRVAPRVDNVSYSKVFEKFL